MDQQTIDFQRDVRIIFSKILESEAEPSTKHALSEMNENDLVINYLNWRHRLIDPRPRNVFKSNKITQTLEKNPHYIDNFNKLCQKITRGNNLTPHLSDRITTPYQHCPTLKPIYGRRDYDLLLNDWGIHHLHLGHEPAPRKRGFLTRGSSLLFGIFRHDEAYLIDIKGHGDFENEELAEITIANWPQHRFFIPLTGLLPGTPWTALERKGLRSFGTTTTVDINGICYISGVTLGLTTAGIQLRLVKQAGAFLRAVRNAELQCLDVAFTVGLYERAHLEIGPRSIPRLGALVDGWGVIDQATDRLLMRIQL